MKVTDYQIAMTQAGFRLITVKACPVTDPADNAEHHTCLWPDAQLAELKSSVAEYHKYSAKVLVQLHYSAIAPATEYPLDMLAQEVAAAAGNCRDAGADAVEVYVQYQLLLPLIEGIKQQVGTEYPVIVRTDDLTMIEIGSITRQLEEAGINALLVSAGSGYLCYLEEKISNSVTIPVLLKFLLLPVANTLTFISRKISCRLARRMY